MSEQVGTKKAVRPRKSVKSISRQTRHGARLKSEPRRRKVDLDGLTDHVGYLTRRAQLWIFQDFRRTLGPLDIRPAQYSVLTVIGANPGLTQMALAHALGIERSRLVHLLDSLQSRSFVERISSAVDRRSHAVHLTLAGQSALVQIKAMAAQHERNVAEKIGPQRRKELLQLLAIFTK